MCASALDGGCHVQCYGGTARNLYRLLLAGIAAQNNRDWVAARQNFDRLSEKFDTGASNLLRSMTLSVGDGDFEQAQSVAHKLQTDYLDEDLEETATESYDFSLVLIAEAFKNKDYDQARSITSQLNQGVLSMFAQPIVETWVAAAIPHEQVTYKQNRLSGLQLVYSAMAAEYAGQMDLANACLIKSR